MKETAYLLQAALINVWWVMLAISPRFFDAFQFDGIPAVSFWAFFAPDVVLIASLSAMRAYYRTSTIEYLILGAFAYATLYCFNASVLTWSGFLSTGVMTIGLLYNVFLCFNSSLFRSSSSGLAWNSVKTFVQIVCIWMLALVVIPYVLLDAFNSEVAPIVGLRTILGCGMFFCSSLLGLTSAYFIVHDGDGTPLPLDQTNQLVVSGPYRYVRNPMAIAGIGQGIAIAIVFVSVPILVYSFLGALVWHLVVRPFEERDMVERFGDSYADYRRNVSCWIPTVRRLNS
jgi:protein-S-isoprenylcysteine O-methyltransferase Ste14